MSAAKTTRTKRRPGRRKRKTPPSVKAIMQSIGDHEMFPGYIISKVNGVEHLTATHEMISNALEEVGLNGTEPIARVYEELPELMNRAIGVYAPALTQMLSSLRQRKRRADPAVQKRVARGIVEFGDLEDYYKPGMEVYVPRDDYAGRITQVELKEGWSGVWFEVNIEVIASIPGQLVSKIPVSVEIGGYNGARDATSQLPVRPLTPEIKLQLTERGKKYRKYVTGAHYLAYRGVVSKRTWFGKHSVKADGRVMIDGTSFREFNNDAAEEVGYQFQQHGSDRRKLQEEVTADIADADLWMTWPVLYGFSFGAKQWGELEVAGLSPIQFRDDAFDKLVLDAEIKHMLLALVTHSGSAFSDIIEDKSGGSIFLLYGPPGTGKTLTAESMAELLQRPLYMVSVGELGVDPDQLESRLRVILDVASRWNAVILLDEADVFLQRRNANDLVRNAMVGVFLRLLEYHNGVLFLTTNRADEIDQAFASRISIRIKYDEMQEETRSKVFTNLFEAAKIHDIKPEQFGKAALNGRQIKSVIRIAQTLAKADNKPLNEGHILFAISKSQQ